MDAAERTVTVLADPTRARILALIARSPSGRVRVGELADELGLRQPTVSHHMRTLREEGMVERHPEGRHAWYSLAPDQADRVAALLSVPSPDARRDPDLERVVHDLSVRFRGVLSVETVRENVAAAAELLADGGTTALLTSRVASFATARLDALSRARRPTPEVPEVLFVCVENAGRSQLAAGILRQLAGDRVRVRTAGSAPRGEVRAHIVAALDEIGVPLAGEFPKPLTDEAVRAADVVVTMGCGDACPVYPGRRYLDWDLDDPAGLPLPQVRVIRDDIAERVRALLDELLPASAFTEDSPANT
ncbi:metalloregulator ArsR/SmtB family transcription factor [Microbacterium sp. T2.11-28]|uniref:metalloregulator ArsR/SmtB family transcription factor n=1 Tax=unclassified Microbacterium TaxID=2609290 RepID=UPI002477344C|nr:metalloregulator ArsR/SmtB family transcription factor [Microbacterium sp. T2.11-28]CAI9387495.1 Arsenate reductase [Microbacterium sp. T2.11-28]